MGPEFRKINGTHRHQILTVNSTTVYVNSTTVYVNSDCEQYRQKLIKNEDEHETFFIKVGSPGSAYASPAYRQKLIKNEDEHETFFIKVGSPGSAYASPAILSRISPLQQQDSKTCLSLSLDIGCNTSQGKRVS
ncbi:hypothetical protein LguiA_023023 [Lonicera macranthoides]